MSVYESPTYLTLGDAERETFKAIWEERDQFYVNNFDREKPSRIYFKGGEFTSKDKLISKLVPEYTGLGNYVKLSIGGRRLVESCFREIQLFLWRAEHKAKIASDRATLKENAASLNFKALDWDVFKNISNVDEMFAVYTPPGTELSMPVKEVDPRAIIEQREAIYAGSDEEVKEKYSPAYAKLLYLPWIENLHETNYTLIEHEGRKEKVQLLNTFEKAPWQKSGDVFPIDQTVFPRPLEVFFNHFFLDDVSKQSVFAWMRRLVFGEDGMSNETALVLNGAKGIGKNMFADICQGLVGTTNFTVGKRSIMKSDFNLDLKDCLCFFLDEIPIKSQEECSKFRAYMNEDLQLEGKGMESKDYRTYKSFILNNNPPHEVRVGWDDRRYTVPDLTSVMLKQRWPVKKIASFRKYIKDFSGLHYKHFASWLFHHADTETYSITYCHKGNRFSEMVLASLTVWQATIRKELLKIKNREEFQENGILLSGIKNACSAKDTWPIETSTIQAFLESYIEKDERLGFLKLVQVEDTHVSGKFTEVAKIFPPDYGQDIIDQL
jgi:hypothetical protein